MLPETLVLLSSSSPLFSSFAQEREQREQRIEREPPTPSSVHAVIFCTERFPSSRLPAPPIPCKTRSREPSPALSFNPLAVRRRPPHRWRLPPDPPPNAHDSADEALGVFDALLAWVPSAAADADALSRSIGLKMEQAEGRPQTARQGLD